MLKKKSGYVVAVVGASGAVGTEMIEVLEERKFPVARLVLLASNPSSKPQWAPRSPQMSPYRRPNESMRAEPVV